VHKSFHEIPIFRCSVAVASDLLRWYAVYIGSPLPTFRDYYVVE